MTNNPDYRLYLEEHFNNINATLVRIEEQTTKTNSRVTHLEDDVEKVQMDLLTHPMNCAQAQEIRKISDDLAEYRIIKKYPKIALYIVVFFVLATIFSIYKFGHVENKIESKLEETKDEINHRIDIQEGVSKTTRGGYIKYNDQGLSDSEKIRDINRFKENNTR